MSRNSAWGTAMKEIYFVEADDYPDAFARAVRQAAAAVGWEFQSEDRGGLVFVDGAGVRHSIGMRKFFRRFRDLDPAAWPARVADYLRTVAGLTEREVNDDLNAQAEQVLVRLGQPIPKAP